MRHHVTIAACVLLLGGCKAFQSFPPGGGSAPPGLGSAIQIYLDNANRNALAPELGTDVAKVEGAMRSSTDSTISLDVKLATKASGETTKYDGRLVTVPRARIVRMEGQVLDRRRTLLVGGGAVVAAVVGFTLLNGDSDGGYQVPR